MLTTIARTVSGTVDKHREKKACGNFFTQPCLVGFIIYYNFNISVSIAFNISIFRIYLAGAHTRLSNKPST